MPRQRTTLYGPGRRARASRSAGGCRRSRGRIRLDRGRPHGYCTNNRTIGTLASRRLMEVSRLTGPFDFPTAVDDASRRRGRSLCCASKGVRLPTFAELAEPARRRRIRAGLAKIGPDDAAPANLYRVNWFNDCNRTGQVATPVLRRAAGSADRREGAHRGGARRAVSDDPGAQGAGGLCLPRPAPGRRPLRSDQAARGVALDRQLLSRRRRHLAHPGLPRRCGAARRHEPGALRLAGRGCPRPRTSCARPAPSPTSRRSTTSAPSWRAIRQRDRQPVQRIRQLPGHWRCTGPALERIFQAARDVAGPRLAGYVSASGSAGTLAAGDYLKTGTARRSRSSRRSSARRCSTTGTASTTSRASATSTSR